MKIRLKLLLIIFSFVLFYAAYYWGIPAVINIKQRIPLIEDSARKDLGMNLKISNPNLKMGILPSVWLEADELKVIDPNSSPLYLKNLKIKVKLFPLILKKIKLAYISSDWVNADLKIDKNNRLYIGEHLLMKVSDSPVSFDKSKMDIQGYKISFVDEINNKRILLNGDYFVLKEYNQDKRIKFLTNSTLEINGHKSIINADIDFVLPFKNIFCSNILTFDGKIINLNLQDLSPYIVQLSKNKLKKIAGIVNVEAKTTLLSLRTNRIESKMVIDKFYLLLAQNPNSVDFKEKLSVFTVLETSKNTLKIKSLKFFSGKIKANLFGEIYKTNSANPKLKLTLNLDKSRIEDYIALLPPINIPGVDINIPALKKYGFYSDIQGKILINGEMPTPKLKGNLFITNGYVVKPLPIPKAKAKIIFKGDKIYIDVFVPAGGKESVRVAGDIELYNKKRVTLNITSTKNVDLKTVKLILVPVHEIFGFIIGPIPIMAVDGVGNINLKTAGNKAHPILNGVFNFKNASAAFDNLNAKLEKSDGNLFFKDDGIIFITRKGVLNGKPVSVKGKANASGKFDFDVSSNSQQLAKLFEIVKSSPMLNSFQNVPWLLLSTSGKVNLNLNIRGIIENFEHFDLNKNVKISGNIKLLGNDFLVNKYKFLLKNTIGVIDFEDNNANFDLISLLNKNKFHLKGKVKDSNIYTKVKLDDFDFSYQDIPIKVFSGNLEMNGNKLILSKINGIVDAMPVFVDGYITDLFVEPRFNLYINSKPTQKFIDKHVNNKAIYPLIIKGDLNFASRLTGTAKSFDAKAVVNLQADSSIYYMGATIGDVYTPIKIYLDSNIAKNIINVKNFQYDKLISSQNNREFISTQLNAKGKIIVNKKNIFLNQFYIRTQNPTDAKVFNILFKKPMIKQGQFTSNIVVNGLIPYPQIIGEANFTGIDIPFLDTTMRDIYLDFDSRFINLKSKGEIFSNQIIMAAKIENNFHLPYVVNNADIYFGNLDINEVMKTLSRLELESNLSKVSEKQSDVFIDNLIVQNANVKAKSIFVKKVFAQDLVANFSLNSARIFNVENFKFNVAEGDVAGSFKHNLTNAQTDLSLSVNGVNANSISDTLFDLPNQIFGSLIGQAELSCHGANHKTCMSTLNGKGGFRVVDGRMPKLGSLEYLLKAANLVKSGVTGLTINSLAELVVPLKTGQFENINGLFSIDSGIANDIQIFSKGKNLSLFVTGSYNFSSLIADMDVFGRISKKKFNVLGPVGNTSVNTLFSLIPGVDLDTTNKTEFVKNLNKIPGFEFNDKSYRIFSAKIYGDINGENYVQTFKWVE